MNAELETFTLAINKLDNVINKLNEAKKLEIDTINKVCGNADVLSECVSSNTIYFSNEFENVINKLSLLKNKLTGMDKFSNLLSGNFIDKT